jgi:hypothetical protein
MLLVLSTNRVREFEQHVRVTRNVKGAPAGEVLAA